MCVVNSCPRCWAEQQQHQMCGIDWILLGCADAIKGAIMIARWNFLPVLIDFAMHNQSVELG